jgi:hypothetical protein
MYLTFERAVLVKCRVEIVGAARERADRIAAERVSHYMAWATTSRRFQPARVVIRTRAG